MPANGFPTLGSPSPLPSLLTGTTPALGIPLLSHATPDTKAVLLLPGMPAPCGICSSGWEHQHLRALAQVPIRGTASPGELELKPSC